MSIVCLRLCCNTESLLSVKKRRLLASLDAALLTSSATTDTASSSCSHESHSAISFTDTTSCPDSHSTQHTVDMDAEFVAFQVTAHLSLIS